MSADEVIDLCNDHDNTSCAIENVVNHVHPSDVHSVARAIRHHKDSNSPKDFLASISENIQCLNGTQSHLLMKLLSLFGLLPIAYLCHGDIQRNTHSFEFLKWLYPKPNRKLNEESEFLNKKFLKLHASLSNSDANCFNLKGITLSMLETILSSLNSIVDKQILSREYFKNDSNILKKDFEIYKSKLKKSQKICFYKRCNKPCNLFYILNGRFVLRDSTSRKKVYVMVTYDMNGSAEVVGLDKKGEGNNLKFEKVFYNQNIKT